MPPPPTTEETLLLLYAVLKTGSTANVNWEEVAKMTGLNSSKARGRFKVWMAAQDKANGGDDGGPVQAPAAPGPKKRGSKVNGGLSAGKKQKIKVEKEEEAEQDEGGADGDIGENVGGEEEV